MPPTDAMDEEDDDQRLLHSLGVTSANIEDIEKKILSQANPQCLFFSLLARVPFLSRISRPQLCVIPHNLFRHLMLPSCICAGPNRTQARR